MLDFSPKDFLCLLVAIYKNLKKSVLTNMFICEHAMNVELLRSRNWFQLETLVADYIVVASPPPTHTHTHVHTHVHTHTHKRAKSSNWMGKESQQQFV